MSLADQLFALTSNWTGVPVTRPVSVFPCQVAGLWEEATELRVGAWWIFPARDVALREQHLLAVDCGSDRPQRSTVDHRGSFLLWIPSSTHTVPGSLLIRDSLGKEEGYVGKKKGAAQSPVCANFLKTEFFVISTFCLLCFLSLEIEDFILCC